MTYLLLGADTQKKEIKIKELKSETLSTPDALKLDLETLDAQKCDAKALKKALISLPAIAKKRFIVISRCEKLNTQNKGLIIDFLSTKPDHVVIVFAAQGLRSNDKFVKGLKPYAKTIDFPKKEGANVFDMTRAIEYRKQTEALKILTQLLADGNHPLQIMGGLVWFWGKQKTRLAQESFEQGLLMLQEADLNIKRSRMRQDNALEVLVIKLSTLLA